MPLLVLLVSCFINFCFSEDAEKIFDLSSEVYSYEYTIPDDKPVNLDFSVIPAKDNQGNAVIYVKYAAVSDEHNITLEVIDSSSVQLFHLMTYMQKALRVF